MEAASKLAHLVSHWIEHNDSHASQFEEWAERARKEGLTDAAEKIAAAAASVRQANEALEMARVSLARAGEEKAR